MSSADDHQRFGASLRESQSLCSERCQNILYKAVFEHFTRVKWIAAILLASKSFQNSSFGANFIVNFVVDNNSILLLESVLSPSSCFSLQFVPSLHIAQSWQHSVKIKSHISKFVRELVNTKYLQLQLRSLTLNSATDEVLSSFFFDSSSSNAWPQLQHLNLENCGVKDSVLEIISKNAFQLRAVNLLANLSINDVGLEHLSKLSSITDLNLTCCSKITDAGLAHLANLSRITSLNLTCCKLITDSGLETISALTNVTSLDLSSCYEIGDSGLEHVAKLSGITSFALQCYDNVTDAGIGHLSKLGSIKSLDLSGCDKITDVGLEQLSKLSNITSLKLTSCNKINDVALEHISKLSNITYLNLADCKIITDAGFEHLSKLSNITYIILWGCDNITAGAKNNFPKKNCIIKN